MKEVSFDVKANAIVQLGENLYKNTYGVLIEYITNSYDADASQVRISIDRTKGSVIIKDDGVGMTLQELNNNFLTVGDNRRKTDKSLKTKKNRLVTGRKGFGKLACFGLFKSFTVETFKNNQKSSLVVTFTENNDGEFEYTAMIDEKSTEVNQPNGTTIYLLGNTNKIVDNNTLCESIAKRLNIMYEGTPEDPEGFKIFLEDCEINKSYRDEIVLNSDTKFSYKIPEDINRFTQDKEIINYIKEKKITGTIIARKKTVRMKENKGVVLFARGKLCQEATYFNINPSNSFGYAHLYAEFHVDFIDNESKDNIGTDRTALKETPTTIELFKVIETLIKAYGTIYDDDKKQKADEAINEFKKGKIYLDIKQSIETISNKEIKKELLRLLDVQIKSNVKDKSVDTKGFENFQLLTNNITPTYILKSEQISKEDVKDNITTSYDHLVQHLRDKYNYVESDGESIFNKIYGESSRLCELKSVITLLPHETQKNTKGTLRELGKAIVAMRNSIYHTSDRKCINANISIENSRRFLVMIDLFIEIDTSFFTTKS